MAGPENLINLRNKIRLWRSILRNTGSILVWNSSEIDTHLKWVKGQFEVPAPQIVKWGVLKRWGGKNLWIETGTYLGDTTQILAQMSRKVISIEPEERLYQSAKLRFRGEQKIQIVHGSSESELENILNSLNDSDLKNVCFWLDGHYSAGETFQGVEDTPIRKELDLISKHIDRFGEFLIFIDDFRCFSSTHSLYPDYPPAHYLVDWAINNGLCWTVEFDIFIIFRTPVK